MSGLHQRQQMRLPWLLFTRQVCGRLGLLSDDIFMLANYQDAVDSFSQRCETYFLELDVSKIKELVIDCGDHPSEPVKVNGHSVGFVDSFKDLGLTLGSKQYTTIILVILKKKRRIFSC